MLCIQFNSNKMFEHYKESKLDPDNNPTGHQEDHDPYGRRHHLQMYML